MSWIMLQIFSMMLASINSIVDKHLVNEHEPSPIIYLASFAVVGLPVTTIGVWLIPWAGYQTALAGLLSGFLFSIAIIFYYQAINLGDVSRLVPLLRLSNIFKLLFLAVFLNDRLTLFQYGAFIFMLIGAISLAHKSKKSKHILRKQRWYQGSGSLLMLSAALFLAIGGVLNSHIILTHSPWTLMVWSNLGRIMGFCLLMLVPKNRVEFRQKIKAAEPRFRTAVVGEQMGRLITSLLSDFAVLSAGSAAITSVLSGLRPFIVMVMATIFLNEKVHKNDIAPRLCGLTLICIGTLLLYLSS